MFKEAFRPLIEPVIESPPCKVVISVLEKSNFVQNQALDFLKRRLNSGKTKLSAVGEVIFETGIEDIKNGEKVVLSEQIEILNGSTLKVFGIDVLESLDGKGALLILNHSNKGHLRGYGNMIAASKAVNDITKNDPIWTHGVDKSTLQDLARPKLSNSIETIAIRDKNDNGLSKISKAVEKGRIVAIYPEGDSSEGLKRGVANAGRLIATTVLKDIPVVYGVSYFDMKSNTYNTAFFHIDPDEIKNIYKSFPKSERNKKTGESRGQKVIDFIMLQLANNLPQEMHGEYQMKEVLRRSLKK